MMRFGLIGHPIAGSGSPALFTKAYHGKWPYDLIDNPDFESAWRRFLSDYQAINITAPYKEPAFRRIMRDGIVDDTCKTMGAINIAVKAPQGLMGYNSDFLGVRKVMSDNGFGADSVAVVVGYGGAGKAAYFAARSLGMDVVVCNRSQKSLAGVSGDRQKNFGRGRLRETPAVAQTRPLEEFPMLAAVADIVVYTLPMLVPEAEQLDCPAILEANYRTPCMQSKARKYIPGKEWLLAQAQTGYVLMTGESPDL